MARGQDLARRMRLEDACRAYLERSGQSVRELSSPLITLGADRWIATFIRVGGDGTPKVQRTLACPANKLEALSLLDGNDISDAQKSQADLSARAQRQLGSTGTEAYLVTVPENGSGTWLYRILRRNAAGEVLLGQDYRLTFRPSDPVPFQITTFHRTVWTLSAAGMPGAPANTKAAGLMHTHMDLADPNEVDLATSILSGSVDVFVMAKDGLYKCSPNGAITRSDRPTGAPTQGKGGPAESEFLGDFRAFAFNRMAFDHENQWVVLPRQDKGVYAFACVYLDEQAGYSSHLGGTFKLDANGRATIDPSLPTDKIGVTIRLQNDFIIAPMPPGIAKDLGLDGRPAFLSNFLPDRETPDYLLRRGFHLNHINECERALRILGPLYVSQPALKGLAFELAYAYNALNQPAKAVPVLEAGVKSDPADPWLARELAYSYLHSGKFREAIAAYERSMPMISADNLQERSEQAMNLGLAYQQLGEMAQRDAWFAKAKAWAPPGSPLANHLATQSTTKP